MYRFFILLLIFNISILATEIDRKVVKQTKGLVITGYGLDKKTAINNGLKNSIEQFISLLVDKDNIVKNNEKLNQYFLLNPDKFIDSSSILSSNNENNLTSMQLNVNVKSQLIFNMLKHLKIPLISNIQSNYTILNINTNKTVNQIINELDELYDHFFTNENLKNIINSNIVNHNIDLNDVIQNRYIPIKISYKLEINNQEYNNFISKLNEIILQIDDVMISDIDYPYYSHGDLKVSNKVKISKVPSKSSFGVITYKDNIPSLNIYTLPKNYMNIKFIKSFDNFDLNNILGLDIIISDGFTHQQISKQTVKNKLNYFLASHIHKNNIYVDGFSKSPYDINIIKPFFDTETNFIKYDYKLFIDKSLSNNLLVFNIAEHIK